MDQCCNCTAAQARNRQRHSIHKLVWPSVDIYDLRFWLIIIFGKPPCFAYAGHEAQQNSAKEDWMCLRSKILRIFTYIITALCHWTAKHRSWGMTATDKNTTTTTMNCDESSTQTGNNASFKSSGKCRKVARHQKLTAFGQHKNEAQFLT